MENFHKIDSYVSLKAETAFQDTTDHVYSSSILVVEPLPV